MIKRTIIRYECEICGASYGTKEGALSCESKPISKDIGVLPGNVVRVTQGHGYGETATVVERKVYSKDWGHYRWERYWHTVGFTVNFSNGTSRGLTFDDYEIVEK